MLTHLNLPLVLTYVNLIRVLTCVNQSLICMAGGPQEAAGRGERRARAARDGGTFAQGVVNLSYVKLR